MEARYHRHKRQAFESFFAFARGEAMPAWPMEIFLEVSNVCDLKCAMCPTFSALNPERFVNLSNAERGLMDLERDVQPLEELLQHAPVVHAHGYGEPTIHPQFTDFIDYVARFEGLVDFFTNGMHLTPELCEFLVSRRVARISISMSGATREDYENVYIGGDFDRLLAGLANLQAARSAAGAIYPRVDVNSIGFKHHVEKFASFVALLGELGVDNINLKPLGTYDTIPELHAHGAQATPELEAEFARAREIAQAHGMFLSLQPFEDSAGPAHRPADSQAEPVAIQDLKHISRATRMLDTSVEMRNSQRDLRGGGEVSVGAGPPCMEPFKTMQVKFSGEVQPCCFSASATGVTNIHAGGDAGVWSCDNFRYMREAALRGHYPRGSCGPCIARGSYPKHHNVNGIVRDYSRWFLKRFGKPFHSSVQQGARSLPSGAGIVDAWQSGTGRTRDGQA